MRGTEKENRARAQAEAQYESIKAMVERLEHTEAGCVGDDCELDPATIKAGLNFHPTEELTAEDIENYHCPDDALEQIQEDPLTIDVRSAWEPAGTTISPAEYQILLCTGGPAARIIGELGTYNEPVTARLEYQDWFTQWELHHAADEAILLKYAEQFYYSEH